MARKTKLVVIEQPNRDKGKTFKITEMDPETGEYWCARALQVLAAGGVEVPENWKAMSAAKLASLGLGALAKTNPAVVKELMDDMMLSVDFVSPEDPSKSTRVMIKHHIEEMSTIMAIRAAWIELHLGFSFGAKAPTLA
jgi:hypothetical protein